MFKKLIALVAMCMSVSVLANVDAKIAPVFEELEYKLSVEWDQKDQAFYKSAVQNFETNLTELSNDGVSPSEVLNYLQSNIKDQKVAGELAELVASIDTEKMTLEESKVLVKEYVDGMKNTGANYSGYYSYDYGLFYVMFGGVLFYTYWYSYYYYYDCYYDYWGRYVCY